MLAKFERARKAEAERDSYRSALLVLGDQIAERIVKELTMSFLNPSK